MDHSRDVEWMEEERSRRERATSPAPAEEGSRGEEAGCFVEVSVLASVSASVSVGHGRHLPEETELVPGLEERVSPLPDLRLDPGKSRGRHDHQPGPGEFAVELVLAGEGAGGEIVQPGDLVLGEPGLMLGGRLATSRIERTGQSRIVAIFGRDAEQVDARLRCSSDQGRPSSETAPSAFQSAIIRSVPCRNASSLQRYRRGFRGSLDRSVSASSCRSSSQQFSARLD